MKQLLLIAIRLTFASILLFCIIYPLLVFVFAPASPGKGEGETISRNGKVAGYALEGQKFTRDDYFWSRPSAVDYNAAGSAGSNKGPTNPEYLKQIEDHIDSFIAHHPGVSRSSIPSELVTASGSGLDPDISPGAALVQVPAIAQRRHLAPQQLIDLIHLHTRKPLLNSMGVSTINVLQLNLALDALQ